MNWWCPPVYLILCLLRHTLNCKCRGILFCLIGLQLHFGLSFVLMAVILLHLSSIGVTCLCLRPCFCLVGVPQASFVQCLLLESWVCYWILIGLLMTPCCSLNPYSGFSILFCHQLSVLSHCYLGCLIFHASWAHLPVFGIDEVGHFYWNGS